MGATVMNLFNSFDHHQSIAVGFGVRTLMISEDVEAGVLYSRLAGMGCQIDVIADVYSALDRIVDGPDEFELIVIDCDTSGGLALAKRAHALLKATGRCIPMMLVSREVSAQQFPSSRYEPTVLRAPLSAVSLRVGFEHVLQERMMFARAV